MSINYVIMFRSFNRRNFISMNSFWFYCIVRVCTSKKCIKFISNSNFMLLFFCFLNENFPLFIVEKISSISIFFSFASTKMGIVCQRDILVFFFFFFDSGLIINDWILHYLWVYLFLRKNKIILGLPL